MILEFVDHWPGRAHVSESGLHLCDVLKVAFWLKMVLDKNSKVVDL